MRKAAFCEFTDNGFFFVAVMPEQCRKMPRTSVESHSSSGNQSFLNLNNERLLATVFGDRLTQCCFVRRCIEQNREKDFLLHKLVVLISEKPQKFQDSRHVGNFDSETILQ